MRKPLVYGLGIVLIISAGLIAGVIWKFRNMPSIFATPTPMPTQSDWPVPADSSASDFPAEPGAPSPYKTEQEWIVSSVCRNAFELLAFAKDKKGEAIPPDKVTLTPIPGDVLSYDVTVKGATVTAEAKLRWPGSLWDPAAYVPFCQAAARALNLPTPTAATAQGNPLHALLDFSDPAIEAENHRVSQWLAVQPDNAAAHEQAALIVGTLAMKENSGWFWDPRDACNHVCTHLAVAKFLRGDAPLSIEGQLANIDVGLIVDTKTQTGADLDALAAQKDAPADLAAWLKADRMRNTRDWRIVSTPESASPFEQVEYARALSEAVNSDAAVTWLSTHSMPDRIDWARVILETGFSVEAGHSYAEHSIDSELHAMQATFPGSFNGTTLVSDLNEPPGDTVQFNSPVGIPTVINRGMWAQYFQRHLLFAIAATGDFFVNKWGVPEYAADLDQKVGASFSRLSMYPYLQLVQAHVRHTPMNSAAALALFTAHPEWASDYLVWAKVPSNSDQEQLHTAAGAWFTPPVVQGTAYGAMSRAPADGWSPEETDRLYAIAPLQIVIAELELKSQYGTTFTFDQFQKVMGPLADYDVEAIEQAKKSTSMTADQQLQLLEKAAAINPDGYWNLAQWYYDSQQYDKAAAAYQKWYDLATDRVAVSNSMDWLVNYYYDHGQQDKAQEIAAAGAEVYSYDGLKTMMNLQDRMGHLDKAEVFAQDINERYNDNSPLVLFYKRHADKGEAGFQAKLDNLVKPMFPGGLKKATLASFSGAPSLGMTFDRTTGEMQSFGFSPGMVVVALDGYAVEGQAQYTFVRSLTDSPEMHFIVWDGQSYKELQANKVGRRFGVNTQDYHR